MANVTFKGDPVTLLGTEIKVGDKAPNFSVLSNSLEEVQLADYKGKNKLICSVPSIDTAVCSAETKRLNTELCKLDNVQILSNSMILPFSQTRWCASDGAENINLLSNDRDAHFTEK